MVPRGPGFWTARFSFAATAAAPPPLPLRLRHGERRQLRTRAAVPHHGADGFTGHITAYANDVGYEHVFVEHLKNFAQAGDIVMAISGSRQLAQRGSRGRIRQFRRL